MSDLCSGVSGSCAPPKRLKMSMSFMPLSFAMPAMRSGSTKFISDATSWIESLNVLLSPYDDHADDDDDDAVMGGSATGGNRRRDALSGFEKTADDA